MNCSSHCHGWEWLTLQKDLKTNPSLSMSGRAALQVGSESASHRKQENGLHLHSVCYKWRVKCQGLSTATIRRDSSQDWWLSWSVYDLQGWVLVPGPWLLPNPLCGPGPMHVVHCNSITSTILFQVFNFLSPYGMSLAILFSVCVSSEEIHKPKNPGFVISCYCQANKPWVWYWHVAMTLHTTDEIYIDILQITTQV